MGATERMRQPVSIEYQELIAANRELYHRVGERDQAGVAALWASTVPVACIHPGWPPLIGREAVLQSWGEILRNPRSPEIRCHDERPVLYGGFGLVLCLELVEGTMLAATNVFIQEEGAWRLIHHQSSPVASEIAEPAMAALMSRGRLN